MAKKTNHTIKYYEPKDKMEHDELELGHLDGDVEDILEAPLDED